MILCRTGMGGQKMKPTPQQRMQQPERARRDRRAEPAAAGIDEEVRRT